MADFELVVTIVSASLTLVFGLILKQTYPQLRDLKNLLDCYRELAIIAVAVVALVEKKYAELGGPEQFSKACQEMARWCRGALTPDQIRQLVELAYRLARRLFAQEWTRLRSVDGADARTLRSSGS